MGPVHTDPRKVTVMVRNLVGNACKFTEHGSVRADATIENDQLVLRCSDTGIGIRREDQRIIFEMFRQADGSDSRRFGGTGLGLYIVRSYVLQLGERSRCRARRERARPSRLRCRARPQPGRGAKPNALRRKAIRHPRAGADPLETSRSQ
jgi:signal transduction histidine kinase